MASGHARMSWHHPVSAIVLVVVLAGCTASGATTAGSARPSEAPASTSPSEAAAVFPVEAFARLGDRPVSAALATELQQVLEKSAHGDGLTATVISPAGTWSGATGFAAGHRAMVPHDQMSIAHITQTLVAAQVMQLVEAGELNLDDRAARHLPAGLEFDTNGATIADLLSHRSGLADTLFGPGVWESLTTDPLHAWTPEEELATVGPTRSPAGQEWDFVGTNYLLLGMIVEHVTGRPLADVLHAGVLDGKGYERLIFQPDERPTEPMAMPLGAPASTLEANGGVLPSIARVTAERAEANMASDAPSLARWFRSFCAGQVVSPASLDEMTDFDKRSEFGLGIWDRRYEYGWGSGALGLTGVVENGYRTAAMCFQDPGLVVVVLANTDKHDVETTAGRLVRAARA
jgi:CubicO group peptidase (beta-lactamase class C family)